MRSFRSIRTGQPAGVRVHPTISNRDRLARGRLPRRCGGLMKGLLILALACTPAMAADLYFYEGSNCPGAGTEASPYCMDPDGIGFNTSFGQLFDGPGLEGSSGDTVHLCCASPCGTGSCTYGLQQENANPNPPSMVPAIDPTGGQDNITIIPYCSGGACATVTLSGDSNGDGRVCTRNLPCSTGPNTEPESFFNGIAPAQGWHFDGDPLGLGTKHIIIEKFGGGRQGIGSGVRGSFFWLLNGGPGLVVENIVMRYLHQSMWDGRDYYDATTAPANDGNGHWGCYRGHFSGTLAMIRIAGQTSTTPRPIFRNNEIYGTCGPVIRLLGPYSPSNSGLDFSDNVVYNTETVFNGHNGKNVRIANNLLYDCLQCLSIEEEVSDFDIEGNTLECRGTYRVDVDNSCVQAISVYEDEGGVGNNCSDSGPTYCIARNIHIRRNIIRGSTYLNEPGDGTGWFNAGINWQAHTSSGHVDAGDGSLGTSVIENNIVSHVQHRWSCDSNIQRMALGIDSDDDLLVQNNTVYDSGCYGIMTNGSGNHILRNNLVVQSYQHYSTKDDPELRVLGSGSLTLQNNNFFAGSSGGNPVAMVGGTSYSCSQINAGNLGTANKCAAPSFVNTTGRPLTWSLLLAASDTADRNAGAAQGPADDIEGDPRNDGQIDIGADEIVSNDTTPPAAPRNLREEP